MNEVNDNAPNDVFVAVNILADLKREYGDYNSIPAGEFTRQFENGLEYLETVMD